MIPAGVCGFLLIISLVQSDATTYSPVERRRHKANNRSESLPQQRPSSEWNNGGANQIDYRLTRLEVQVAEKAEVVRSELRETNRRLQNLEFESVETQSTLEGLKDELNRFLQTPQQEASGGASTANLEVQIHNLANGVKLVVSALRVLNSDIAALKQNISQISNTTGLLLQATDDLVSKQYFNNEMLEMRHQQGYHHTSLSTCSSGNTGGDSLPKTCTEVRDRGSKESGIYRIQPGHSSKAFMAFCELESAGGGWTVIQNRLEGSQDFYQRWHDYKHGFGNLGGEFWLGLDNIHELTGFEVNELLIELEDFNQSKAIAHYGAFSIGPEVEGYPLKVLAGYTGDAGDSLIYHAGSRFSARDMDQDAWQEGSCAQAHGGGWWYRNCDTSNLNGKYLSGPLPDQYQFQGMYWGDFGGAKYSLMKSRMLVRPKDDSKMPMFRQEESLLEDEG